VLAVLLSLWNWYRRYEAGDAAVLPTGLLISLLVVLILLYTGWRGWEMVYEHGSASPKSPNPAGSPPEKAEHVDRTWRCGAPASA
jgi:predicted membrane protein DUF2231